MKMLFPIALACASLVMIGPASAGEPPAAAAQPALTQPDVSPDGSEIAFAADGAVWIVPAKGGTARILVSDSGTDSRPLFSPDGKYLAFESDTTGNGDIYLLDRKSGALRRLTFADSPDRPSAFSRDGKWLYYTSSRGNIGGMGGVYRVRVAGGTPMPVSRELYRNEEAGAPSPDGKTIALVGEGWGSAQWWRHGRAHIDDSAIWLLKNDGSHDYSRLTPDDARALWPMWASDGNSVYYMSDRSGADNIWKAPLKGKEQTVTHFSNGRCLWPRIAADGKIIVFERNFSIWTLATASGKAHKVAIRLGGAVAGPGTMHKTFHGDFSDLALSPDGRKLAFIAHGDIFARGAKKAGPAQQITHTPAAEFGIVWAPDSKRIAYVSAREGTNHIYMYDFKTGKEKRLTDGAEDDDQPVFSPDGKSIAFVRGAKKLDVLKLSGGHVRTLATGELNLHHPLNSAHSFAWSPDGRWIAFMAWGKRWYRNVEIVPVAGGKPRAASFLGNTFSGSLRWSPDGKSLYFATGQRTETGRIARVNLTPQTPEFHEQKFLDLFQEQTPPGMPGAPASKTSAKPEKGGKSGKKTSKPKRVVIDFDGIAERLKLLPVGLSADSVVVSPDGKTLVFDAMVAGHDNLYTWPLNPLANKPPVAHQITSTAGNKSSVQFSSNGKRIWYIDDGRIHSVSLKGGEAKSFATSASMDINFAAEKEVVFHEAWTWLDKNYHNPKMNGVNWQAVRKRYAPLVAGAANPDTLHRILRRMVGELDSSHSGVRGPGHPAFVTGNLGLRFAPATYEKRGLFKIAEVVPLSPAAVTGKIAAGDYLLAVDGKKLGQDTNVYALLAHRIGKETVLTVADGAGGKNQREVKVKPVNTPTMTKLTYEMWTEHNRQMVAKLSHGKLGYIDLPDMSLSSLQRLYRKINARNGTKEGVVIDVRNNYGGFVNAYALDALARKPYLHMTFRGATPVAARPVLGQPALERPTDLITNRVTLSDGEDFTEGYEELGLGKVVGEPTAGWIIYTSDVRLIDGATVRLPFITVTTEKGKPMELHPRPVDVPVAEPLGESYRGKDARIAAAVKTLLHQLQSKQER
ncbi:MAG: S41 family peptidase [Gammaproteobacteria bacterium]